MVHLPGPAYLGHAADLDGLASSQFYTPAHQWALSRVFLLSELLDRSDVGGRSETRRVQGSLEGGGGR